MRPDPAAEPAPSAHAAPYRVRCCLAVVALVLVAFSPAFVADFVTIDDPGVLLNNPHIRSLSGENVAWMFTESSYGHYHPLTWLSYAIEYRLWGLDPAGYHAVNVALHGLNAVLVLLLARRLFLLARPATDPAAATIFSAVAAALWAVHPLRAESVCWVTERRDVLSAAFLLGATLAYLSAVNTGAPGFRSPRHYALCILLLALSLLSKAWGMSFFVLMLVLDWYPLRRWPSVRDRGWARTAVRLLLEKAPLAVLGIAAAAMAATAQHEGLAARSLGEWGLLDRALQSIYGLWFYLSRSVLPLRLSPLYELPHSLSPTEPRILIAALGMVAIAVAVVALRRPLPALAAAAAVYTIILLPVLGLLQSGNQLVADRYSYLAAIGPTLLVAAAFCRPILRSPVALPTGGGPPRPRTRPLFTALTGLVVLTLAVLTFNQATIWRSTEALWGHAVAVTPTTFVLTNHAIELGRLNRHEEGVVSLLRAVAIDPDNGRAWFMLGNLHRDAGRFSEAEIAFTESTRTLPQAYMAHVNLGALYLTHLDRPAEALSEYRKAVADVERGPVSVAGVRRTVSALPYIALGNALRKTGDPAGAREAFTKALADPETRADAEKELKTLRAP